LEIRVSVRAPKTFPSARRLARFARSDTHEGGEGVAA
jgi:hypothetical protein